MMDASPVEPRETPRSPRFVVRRWIAGIISTSASDYTAATRSDRSRAGAVTALRRGRRDKRP